MKPSHKKPYYYIINNNVQNEDPTNKPMDSQVENKDGYGPEYYSSSDNNDFRFYGLKKQYSRISNQSTVKLVIYTGDSD